MPPPGDDLSLINNARTDFPTYRAQNSQRILRQMFHTLHREAPRSTCTAVSPPNAGRGADRAGYAEAISPFPICLLPPSPAQRAWWYLEAQV